MKYFITGVVVFLVSLASIAMNVEESLSGVSLIIALVISLFFAWIGVKVAEGSKKEQ